MQPSNLTCPMQPSKLTCLMQSNPIYHAYKTCVLVKHESVKTFTEIKIQSNQVDNKPNIRCSEGNIRLDLIAPKHKINVDNN